MRVRTNILLTAAAAAAALCGSLFAQPEIAFGDPQQPLLEQIADLRAEAGGARPAGLIDPLAALAMAHQEAGEHVLAIAALEEARYVTRVNNGLASADEAVLLRQQIRSEKALGLHERVWDLEQRMVTIARQHHDDSRMLPIFSELADDRLAVMERFRAGERPPMIELGCYYSAPLPPYDETRRARRPPMRANPDLPRGSCRFGDGWLVINSLRAEILMYYADAIEIIVKTGDYASPELRRFEKAAVRVARDLASVRMTYGDSGSFAYCSGGTLARYLALDILTSCLAPVGRARGVVVANVGGLVSLIRLIAYEIRSGASAADRARAIAELADWYLLATPVNRRHFEERIVDTARMVYERAYRELRRSADEEASIAPIFAPELPVTLPTFEPNPLASNATAEPSRYIDVAFNVTKYGRGEQIEILDTSRGATRGEERDLIRLIEGTTFRLRVVDGKLADSAPVSVRYHLSR
jgi:hypothetical protein